MKFFIVFALFLASTNAIDPSIVQEFLEKVTRFGEICMEETHASGEDVAQIMAHQMPTSHEGKCMISCVYKAFKIQNADGSMNLDETMKLVERIKESDPDLFEKVLGVFKKCQGVASITIEDPCIAAASVAACAVLEGRAAGLKADMFGI